MIYPYFYFHPPKPGILILPICTHPQKLKIYLVLQSTAHITESGKNKTELNNKVRQSP